MQYQQAIAAITPDIYHNMKLAIEIGKWPDGREVSVEQRQHCLQAIIAYEDLHDIPADKRTGYIDRGDKAGDSCDTTAQPLPMSWQN